MSEITGIKFRPVMGPEERIKATVQSNGYMYVATDTGNMYLDVNNHRISIGGASGSGGSGSTGFVWASADEELGSIVKATDDYSDGDPVFYFNPSAIDDGIVPKIDTLILNSDGRFFRVVDVNSPLEGFITVELIAVSGGGEGGGGGGSSTVDLDLSWSGIDLLGATYIYEKDAEITFIPNSLADEICSLSITVTDATGAEVYKKDFRVNNNTRCVINASNFPVSNNLTLTALVKSDHSTYNRGNGLSKTFKPIKVFKMYLEKPTDLPMMGIVSTAASLAYIPYYTGLWTQQNPVKLYYNVDGGD